MSWLKRLFGQEKPQKPQAAISGKARTEQASTRGETIPSERVGLNGEYDESGLAKRVALAFDEDPQLDDIETLYVAQTGSTVVLKGEAPNQQILDKMVKAAKGVNGARNVDTSEVSVG